MPQAIYCDEAGFSGNDLLNAGQPFFTYSAVAVDHDVAHEATARVLRDFRVDGGELKGNRLLRHSRGQKAITAILERFQPLALVSANHKRYCLATKFFEYVFEPVLAEQNSIFYNSGFHRFIANILFFEAVGNNEQAAVALSEFQGAMRQHDGTAVQRLFPGAMLPPDYSDIFEDIRLFVEAHHEAIAEEIASFAGADPMHRWVLDLSVSALFSLLTTWGQRFESLVVSCDQSKPLYESREPFDMMIGRTDKAEVWFEGKRQHIVFNLAEPLQFVDSVSHPGIQIADVFATALSYCLRNPQEEVSKRWLRTLGDSISEFSVFPDQSLVDLKSPHGFVNRLVLRELVERSQRKTDLFAGMPHFIARAKAFWLQSRISRSRLVLP